MLSDHAAPFGLEGIQEYKPIANPRPGILARTYHFVSYAQKYQYPGSFLDIQQTTTIGMFL